MSRGPLGVTLLQLEVQEVPTFCESYFQALMESPGSIWYAELRNNTNLTNNRRYELPPENRLLHFLFADARVAESLAVYRPVGNYVIKELDRLARLGQADQYNWALDDFQDEGRWRSSLWTGILFFDIMVSAALWQGVRWHMWLYYYPAWVDRIVRNYNPNHDVLINNDLEWPTKYGFLLYEIVSNLGGWIRELEHLPLDQENVQLESQEPYHENGNIPKSAILALGQCYRHILLSRNLPKHLQNHLLRTGFSLYFFLRTTPHLHPYATVLVKSIRQGGTWVSNREAGRLRELVLEAFADFDQIPHEREHVAEFVNLMQET